MFHSILVSTDDMHDSDDFEEETEDSDEIDTDALRALNKDPKEVDDEGRLRRASSTTAEKFKKKVRFISKMLVMQKVLREQSENVLKIKEMNDNKLPSGILLQGCLALKTFKQALEADSENERIPY